MRQTRRRYLQYIGGSTIVTGLAGCSGDTTSGTRPAGTGGPGVTLTETAGDVSLPIQPAVEVVRDTATADAPPRLRTTLTNTGDEDVTVGEGRAVHF